MLHLSQHHRRVTPLTVLNTPHEAAAPARIPLHAPSFCLTFLQSIFHVLFYILIMVSLPLTTNKSSIKSGTLLEALLSQQHPGGPDAQYVSAKQMTETQPLAPQCLYLKTLSVHH